MNKFYHCFTSRILTPVVLLLLLITASYRSSAQCTGCTQTVTNNNSSVTISSGQVVCITYAGTFTKSITLNGGTLCIGPSTTVSSGINMPSGATLSIYGDFTGSMSQNGGAITAYSGGTFHPSSFNVNGGSLTINAGASCTLGTPNFPSGYVFNNYGALTIAGFTLNSGSTVNLSGTSQTISNSVTNNGTLTINGPTTISGAFSQNSSGASSFINGVTVSGSVSNNGTINLDGTFTVGGAYVSNTGATIKATGSSGCNAVSVAGGMSGAGTFNGNGNDMTISPTPSCCMINGATGVPTTPTQQPTSPNGTLTGSVVSGSFTAPSASIGGYIVLRYIGTTAPTCNPSNNTEYTAGSTIGTCTVAALVTGGSTGTKSFTDNIPSAATNCGKNIYYRIFSYNGSGACAMFDVTSPLTGSIPIPAFTATATASGATTFCSGSSVTLTASAGTSYIWGTGQTTQSITATATGVNSVTVTNSLGCTATASKTIVVNPSPTAVITPSGATTFCAGGSVTLTASGGSTYAWSTGATTAAITATTAGTYIVTATSSGCTDTALRVVTVTPRPTAVITPSGATTFCAGGTVTLTGSGGTTYAWSTGATTAAITATTSGTYILTATSSGCTDTALRVVTVNPAPTAVITASGATTFCAGSSVTLTGSGGTTYAWSTGATTAAITVTTSGTYILTATSAGCTDTALRVVTVSPKPNAVMTASGATTFCPGGSVTLTGSGGSTYTWSTGATTAAITATTSGTYIVTVTSGGCTDTAMGVVTVRIAPSPTVNSPSVCSGTTATLTATGGGTYLWNTGATTASITTVTTGTYTVTVTAVSTCTATASGTATIHPLPVVTASSNTPVCVGTTIAFTASATGATSYTYSWSGPSGYTSTGASPTVANTTAANSGTYYVTVTDNNTCTATTSTAVAVDATCADSTTAGANGGNSSDAPCTQILRFDHYNDAVAGAGGQNHTWIMKNGNKLTMTITRTAGAFTSVIAPTWSGAAFGQSGYTGLSGKTVLYTTGSGYSKVVFSNIQMKDSNGAAINNFTLIGIDAESTDNAERDTLVSNGTSWFDYDTITPPGVNSVPLETGIGTSNLIWTGTGAANARARLVSTNNPTSFSFSTIAGGLQAFAMGIANPIQAPTALTICSRASFNATPTNLPVGTTYTWTAPVISPVGSITGATAQTTPVALVGQPLTNTTTAIATATYTVVPSNNCSGLGYTVTITVQPSPVAAITATGPVCIGGTVTVTATPTAGAPLTYSWSGPSSYTSTASTFTITNGTAAQSGTYTVTITGSNTCTATATAAVNIVNCVSVKGSIFDDANGNGAINGKDSIASFGQTVYAVMADTNSVVINSAAIAADGSFTVGNILPSTSGMTLRMSATNPTAGTAAPTASWPANWQGTLGQYGTNNLAGTGVYNNASELIPVSTGTQNITGILVGYDRLAGPWTQSYVIRKPARSSIRILSTADSLGNVAWNDPEDGLSVGSFVVSAVTNMHGNTLFYDSNANNIADPSEIINGYKAIAPFNPVRLKMKFSGTGSNSASFAFGYIDAAGKTNPAPSTYTVSWIGGALPVKLEYFTAQKQDEHSAKLAWATASEINNDHFEIERSADAQNWTKIGEVKGAGQSNEILEYSLIDDQPLSGSDYYRLKQVDYDGNYTYSDVAVVEFGSEAVNHSTAVMSVYPNPVTHGGGLNIALVGTADGIRHIAITNEVGQQVYSTDPSDMQGYRIAGLNLAPGMYIVSIISQSNETFSSRIIMQ